MSGCMSACDLNKFLKMWTEYGIWAYVLMLKEKIIWIYQLLHE